MPAVTVSSETTDLKYLERIDSFSSVDFAVSLIRERYPECCMRETKTTLAALKSYGVWIDDAAYVADPDDSCMVAVIDWWS